MNPRPSLRKQIEVKPHECQFTFCHFSDFLRHNSLSVWFAARMLVVHLMTGTRVLPGTLIEVEVAQAVADAAEAAERGGKSSGIRIGERRFHLEGRQLGTEATEETVDAPADQPIEEPKETEEQIVNSPQRHRSGRTRAQVTARPEGQRRGGRPPPRVRGHPLVEHFDLRGATAR
jgi:hypothetical protein